MGMKVPFCSARSFQKGIFLTWKSLCQTKFAWGITPGSPFNLSCRDTKWQQESFLSEAMISLSLLPYFPHLQI